MKTVNLTIIGDHPLAMDANGNLKSRIATIFPDAYTLVTLPGVHATQRIAFVDQLNQERRESGLAPLTEAEEEAAMRESVDLIVEGDSILIRPDPANLELAFRADERLQELIPKQDLKFLHLLNPQVWSAIKQRGECWRINPLPRSPAEMRRMIAASRIGIGGQEIYYYNKATGTRFLTYQEFTALGSRSEQERRAYLKEVKDYSARTNRLGNPEIAFFMANGTFSNQALVAYDFRLLDSAQLAAAHHSLQNRFRSAIQPEFEIDNLNQVEWRNGMFASLVGREPGVVSEEILLGLSPEFFMQIEWLPGGRIDGGELLFDSIFDANLEGMPEADLSRLHNEKSRSFIFNFIREYGDLEYVNLGRVIGSLSYRPAAQGRRDVYVAEIKLPDHAQPIVRIIRMQKWGVREHLDAGKSLLNAMLEAEDYTEYTLDRRLGCRQLGMNLPARVTAKKISERYSGTSREYEGRLIWSAYFERDYIHGIATDKMPHSKFANERFAMEFARLLGQAAAPNLMVGRSNLEDNVIFDDGDEVVVLDGHGIPAEIIVADHTGTFFKYLGDLRAAAPAYARPINQRAGMVANPQAFANAYLSAFRDRFFAIQEEYRRRKRAFDTLAKHRRRDEAGSFAYRWEMVLERLARADPLELEELIRSNLNRP